MKREFIRDQKEKWKARKSSAAATKTLEINSAHPNSLPMDAKPAQVILDFRPQIDDRPRNRKRDLILRNVSSETVVNVIVEPFSVGETSIVCDATDRLLPNGDTATLTSEIRRAGDVRKPCLVQLDRLFELELSSKRKAGL